MLDDAGYRIKRNKIVVLVIPSQCIWAYFVESAAFPEHTILIEVVFEIVELDAAILSNTAMDFIDIVIY